MTETPAATRLHPWNRDFAMDRPRRSVPHADRRPGGAVRRARLRRGADVSTATRWPRRADRDRPVRGRDGGVPARGRRRPHRHRRGGRHHLHHPPRRPVRRRCARLSPHPIFAGICADLVGPDVNLYWDQAVYKKPEKPRRFPWHQDNGYAFVEPQQYLTCWVALTDATVRQRLPAGRARAPPARARSPTPTSTRSAGSACTSPTTPWPPRCRAGGAVVFSSLTPAPHRPQHHRRGPQGLHPPVRARRRGDPPRRPARGPPDGPRVVRRARAPVPRDRRGRADVPRLAAGRVARPSVRSTARAARRRRTRAPSSSWSAARRPCRSPWTRGRSEPRR